MCVEGSGHLGGRGGLTEGGVELPYGKCSFFGA